jgi:flagellin-like hook-associated protein FlgL
MLEVKDVCDTAFSKWPVSRHYNWADGTLKPAADDRSVAKIREYLADNIADVRLSARNANAASSMVQMFVDAASDIRDKLIQMQQLAEEAAYGYCPDLKKAVLQKQLGTLAADINKIVADTSYTDDTEEGVNKLFSGQGDTIERRIDKTRTIKLFPKNLTFNIEDVNLKQDTTKAWKVISTAAKAAAEYTDYLGSQTKILQDSMATIERKMTAAAGFDSSSFETETAQQITTYLAKKISENPFLSSKTQSNITPDEALYLLKMED